MIGKSLSFEKFKELLGNSGSLDLQPDDPDYDLYLELNMNSSGILFKKIEKYQSSLTDKGY